ncbi:MAG: hypothetical protein KGH91_00260 [Rhodospirillales bacterium]|nr:hypothetical protein [Rhodospirillales bacterium]
MNSSNVPASTQSTNRTFLIVSTILIAVLWLSTRPYQGIIDDSRFYTVQALNALLPGRFSNDLYFQYGSQDQFTIFTKIYAPFISAFGLSSGNLILTLLSQVFAASGAIFFSYTLIRDWRILFISLAALILLPNSTFFMSYGEPFLTPRLMAEALTFWGLGCMLNRWIFSAVAIFIVSTLIHPLMTIPGIAVFFFYEAIKKPFLWIGAILGAVIFLGLAFLGMQPFAKLLMCFDPAWLHTTKIRSFYCFVTGWNLQLWTLALNSASTSLFAMLFFKGRERQILILALTVMIFGTLVTYIGGDLFRNVLIVDIQLWRSMWLLNALTSLFLGKILMSSGNDGSKGTTYFILCVLVIILALSAFFEAFILFVTPLCLLGIWVYIVENRTKGQISRIGKRLITVYLSVIFAFAIIALKVSLDNLSTTHFALLHHLIGLLAIITAGGLLFALCRRSSVTVPRFVVYASAFLLLTSVANWDQRTPWTKFVDTTSTPPADLVAVLPQNGAIYWDGDVTAPWFLLKRASQFSCDQGTGVLFSHGTAIAYQTRYQIFARLGTLDFEENQFCPMPKFSSEPAVTLKNLTYVCKSQPGLGALVLTTPASDAPARIWTSPVAFQAIRQINGRQTRLKTDKFYIYRCDELSHLPAS